MSEHKDPERVAAGYKATIHNPHVSQDAKEHAINELHALGKTEASEGPRGARTKPRSPPPAPDHAHARREVGGLGDTPGGEGHHHKNEGNIIGGYKATLKNPHASKEAKTHAADYLRQHGVDLGPYQDEIKGI